MGWETVLIDGQKTRVKQEGQRIEQLDNFGPDGTKDHLVSNDGTNANYVRINGKVIVDDRKPDPYGG